jgi:hypothetical protein
MCDPNCAGGIDIGAAPSEASPGQDPIQKITKAKQGWEHGSSSRISARSSNSGTTKKAERGWE